jgi:hypothetical protein
MNRKLLIFLPSISLSMEWESFLPPFFGVLAAFVLQWVAKRYDKRRNRLTFLDEVKKELQKCSELLTGGGNLLPIDMWGAGKASGLVNLVKGENKLTLASMYFRIQCHNYTAEKCWDIGVIAKTTKGEKPKGEIAYKHPLGEVRLPSDLTYPELLWNEMSANLRKEEEQLKKDIDSLLKQDIWK